MSSIHTTSKGIAVVVTCDLPIQPVQFNTHLDDLKLADPDFGQPVRIDVLLGIDVYTDAMQHGRRSGPPGSPAAFETIFDLAGKIDSHALTRMPPLMSQLFLTTSGNDLLRQFWDSSNLSSDERSVIQHFKDTHTRTEEGRFIVPLPKKPKSKPLGESRSQAVRRFLSLEKSLCSKGQFKEEMEHAEPVPLIELSS